MTPIEPPGPHRLFLVLGGLAVDGWHRYYLVYVYMKHRNRVPPRPPAVPILPRVTIQLPLNNVVERRIDAMCRLEHPRQLLQIQVLLTRRTKRGPSPGSPFGSTQTWALTSSTSQVRSGTVSRARLSHELPAVLCGPWRRRGPGALGAQQTMAFGPHPRGQSIESKRAEPVSLL